MSRRRKQHRQIKRYDRPNVVPLARAAIGTGRSAVHVLIEQGLLARLELAVKVGLARLSGYELLYCLEQAKELAAFDWNDKVALGKAVAHVGNVSMEISRRWHVSKSNRLLGEWLLALRLKGRNAGLPGISMPTAEEAHRAVAQYGMGIVRRKGYFDPEGDDRWKEVISDYLIEADKQHSRLGVDDIKAKILDRGFAGHLGRALECDFKNLLKRVIIPEREQRELLRRHRPVFIGEPRLQTNPTELIRLLESEAMRLERQGSMKAARGCRIGVLFVEEPEEFERKYGPKTVVDRSGHQRGLTPEELAAAIREADRELNLADRTEEAAQKASEQDWKASQKHLRSHKGIQAIADRLNAQRAEFEEKLKEQRPPARSTKVPKPQSSNGHDEWLGADRETKVDKAA